MHIINLEVGNLGTNCYIVYDQQKQAGVIDPGGSAPQILRIIAEQQLKVVCIINTHGHADHILANKAIQDATGAPIFIHADDAAMLTDKHKNLSLFVGAGITFPPPARLLQDGDTIQIGDISLRVLHTPGHTPGGISLYGNGVVFVGDALFYESIGRTDFPGGSYRQLIGAIQKRLLTLPDETRVLPGHGPETTIGHERRNNPFLQ